MSILIAIAWGLSGALAALQLGRGLSDREENGYMLTGTPRKTAVMALQAFVLVTGPIGLAAVLLTNGSMGDPFWLPRGYDPLKQLREACEEPELSEEELADIDREIKETLE